jgi:hypothetical protein
VIHVNRDPKPHALSPFLDPLRDALQAGLDSDDEEVRIELPEDVSIVLTSTGDDDNGRLSVTVVSAREGEDARVAAVFLRETRRMVAKMSVRPGSYSWGREGIRYYKWPHTGVLSKLAYAYAVELCAEAAQRFANNRHSNQRSEERLVALQGWCPPERCGGERIDVTSFTEAAKAHREAVNDAQEKAREKGEFIKAHPRAQQFDPECSFGYRHQALPGFVTLVTEGGSHYNTVLLRPTDSLGHTILVEISRRDRGSFRQGFEDIRGLDAIPDLHVAAVAVCESEWELKAKTDILDRVLINHTRRRG